MTSPPITELLERLKAGERAAEDQLLNAVAFDRIRGAHMKFLRKLLFLAGAVGLYCEAAAQNLVQNPDFDNGLSGWTVSTFVSAVTPNDQDGSFSAPSAQLSNWLGSGEFPHAQLTQCLALAGGPPGPWDFGGRSRVVASKGSFTFYIRMTFKDSDCGTTPTFSIAAPDAVPGIMVGGVQGPFTQFSISGLADPLPGGSPSRSAEIRAFVRANGISSGITLNLDKLYFGPAGTTPVELLQFEVE